MNRNQRLTVKELIAKLRADLKAHNEEKRKEVEKILSRKPKR